MLFLLYLSVPAYGEGVIGVAHRGGRMLGPENTLEVFQLSMNLGVTPWLETDSWESSDGVLMLHHDRDLCRTTDIETWPGYDCVVEENNPLGRFPRVADFTAAELKTLDAGSWFSPAFAGAEMPTLEEALTLVDGTGTHLVVEVKTVGQAVIIEEILDRTGMSFDNLIIWARAPFAYQEFHTHLPGIRQITGIFDLGSVTHALLAQRAAAGDYGIAFHAVGLTRNMVERVQSYGLITYSVPTPTGQDTWEQQVPLGVNALHVGNELAWADYLATRPCIDRLDNDGDGFADADGIDLDFDGVPEIPADAGCLRRLFETEVSDCQDGVDNDGDSLIDLDDPGCTGPNSPTEYSIEAQVPSFSSGGLLLLCLAVVSVGAFFSRRGFSGA
ncbi:MAG: hypothetical protein NXI30_27860 [bacterium]|nr:hypothetical protein [bacterium]